MATVNKFVCYGDIEPKKVEWLYYPYIPKGKITIICGDPGIGSFVPCCTSYNRKEAAIFGAVT